MFNQKRPNGSVNGSANGSANGSGGRLDKGEPLQKAKVNRVGLTIDFIIFVLWAYSIGSSPQLSRLEQSFDIPTLGKSCHSFDAPKLGNSTIGYQPNKIPDGWETYPFIKVYHHFECRSHAYDQTKPLHSLEQWQHFRTKYMEVADATATFDGPVPPTLGYTIDNHENPPPFTASFSHGKGRGLFASRLIKKGELVHHGTRSKVTFPNAMAWRRFVFSLPRHMACDIAEWSWTQKLSENGKHRLHVDLNISAFMNSGDENSSNVGPWTRSGVSFYAIRDIEKGDEIMYNYEVYETNWAKAGL